MNIIGQIPPPAEIFLATSHTSVFFGWGSATSDEAAPPQNHATAHPTAEAIGYLG
jgi:hypothetical protein